MKNDEPAKKIEQPINLSYIDTERGFQINAQSIDDIFEHISPSQKYRGSIDLKEEGVAVEIYANDKFWTKKNYLFKQ